MEKIELEARQFGMVQHVSAEVVEELGRDRIANMFALQFAVRIFGHRLAEWDATLEAPTNWWQHLRSQLGLKFKKRMRYAHIERWRMYPELPLLPEGSAGACYVQEDSREYGEKP